MLAVLLTGCTGGSDASTTAGSPSPTPSTSSSSAPAPALVGEWQRLQRCPELVGLLRKADMPAAVPEMLAGDGWVPGVSIPARSTTTIRAGARSPAGTRTSSPPTGSSGPATRPVSRSTTGSTGLSQTTVSSSAGWRPERRDLPLHGDRRHAPDHPRDPGLPAGLLPGRVERGGGVDGYTWTPDRVISVEVPSPAKELCRDEDPVWVLARVRAPAADGPVDPGGPAGRPRRRRHLRSDMAGPGRETSVSPRTAPG